MVYKDINFIIIQIYVYYQKMMEKIRSKRETRCLLL